MELGDKRGQKRGQTATATSVAGAYTSGCGWRCHVRDTSWYYRSFSCGDALISVKCNISVSNFYCNILQTKINLSDCLANLSSLKVFMYIYEISRSSNDTNNKQVF